MEITKNSKMRIYVHSECIKEKETGTYFNYIRLFHAPLHSLSYSHKLSMYNVYDS